MFILYGDEHQLMPNENRVILRLQNENGRWNRESYVHGCSVSQFFGPIGMQVSLSKGRLR